MVRSRGGKTMSKSSSKEQTYACYMFSAISEEDSTVVRSAEENTPIATSEKREKTKKAKKSQKVQENVIFTMKLLSLSCVFDG